MSLLATEAFSTPANNPDMPAGLMDETNVMTGRKASFIAVLCNKLVNQWLHVIFQFRQKSLCLLAVNSLEPTHL